MNLAREELRNMKQKDKESVRVYPHRWRRALVRSSGIFPEDERHPHMIKDFISSIQKNVRNKIANKWSEMRNHPRTIQEAFNLAAQIETQIQVADSFKIDLNNDFPTVDINEICADESSCDKFKVNEMSKGKRWGNNSNLGKTVTIIKISTINLGTTKHRIASQQRSGNKRRDIQGSL